MGLLDGLLGAALGGNSGGGIQGALLQAVLSQVMGGGQQQSGGGLGGMLGGLLGGGQQQQNGGGLGGLLGSLLGGGANTAEVHNQAAGGLGNLTGMLSQLGLGDQVNSWIGTGENQPVTADQIQSSLGQNGTLSQIAQQAGVSEQEAAGGLADLLPGLINKLTPNGKIDANDIGSILSQLTGK